MCLLDSEKCMCEWWRFGMMVNVKSLFALNLSGRSSSTSSS